MIWIWNNSRKIRFTFPDHEDDKEPKLQEDKVIELKYNMYLLYCYNIKRYVNLV